MARYSVSCCHGHDTSEWRITDLSEDVVVFRHPWKSEDYDLDNVGVPPAEVRAELERREGRGEFLPDDKAPDSNVNIVEMISGSDSAWDQPCRYGHRVEMHAVYCHNDAWLYAPTKCRRNRTDWPHEECRGFKPNAGTQ